MATRVRTAVQQLVMLAFVFGVMFLGWGLDDFGGFFAQRARLGLLVLVLVGYGVAVAFPVEVRPFRKGKQAVGIKLLGAWIAGSIVLMWFLPYGDRRGLLTITDSALLRDVGLVLCVIGGVVRGVGLSALGRQFSVYVTLQENHRLVQTGIYRMIRHPMYLGGLLMMPGFSLVFRSWLAIPAFVLTAAFVVRRIRQEELLLAEQFGSEYEAYRRRTWRLLPYIY